MKIKENTASTYAHGESFISDGCLSSSSVYIAFPFTIDWAMVMLFIAVSITGVTQTVEIRLEDILALTKACKHTQSNMHRHPQINTNYTAILFPPQFNPVRAHQSVLFYISFIAQLMSCFDNMSESH